MPMQGNPVTNKKKDKKKEIKGMVEHTFNPGILEVEASKSLREREPKCEKTRASDLIIYGCEPPTMLFLGIEIRTS